MSKKTIRIMLAGSIALIILGGNEANAQHDLNDRYLGTWNPEFNMEITQSLSKNKISGCGEYEHKIARTRDEYLVRCTRDGMKWTYYIIFPLIKKVVGPINLNK